VDIGAVLLLILFVILAMYITQFVFGVLARRQDETQSQLSPERIAHLAAEGFGSMLWKDEPGPGSINKRRRTLNGSGPLVSIDVEAISGGSSVSIWMSEWSSRGGIINFAGTAFFLKRKILRRVHEA
jgi:hypothetical protein